MLPALNAANNGLSAGTKLQRDNNRISYHDGWFILNNLVVERLYHHFTYHAAYRLLA